MELHLAGECCCGLFNRGMRLCWNGKYGGSGPTSSLEHRAWRKDNSDSTGRARRRYDRPRCVSRLESMTWGRTRRGPRSINADDSGSEEDGPPVDRGPGAVDPGERGVLTDRTTADCGGA